MKKFLNVKLKLARACADSHILKIVAELVTILCASLEMSKCKINKLACAHVSSHILK